MMTKMTTAISFNNISYGVRSAVKYWCCNVDLLNCGVEVHIKSLHVCVSYEHVVLECSEFYFCPCALISQYLSPRVCVLFAFLHTNLNLGTLLHLIQR